MTPQQMRLRRQVLALVAAEVGLTDRQLASRLGVTTRELKPVVGQLIGTRRLDSCWGYLVLPVRPAAEERAA